MRIAGHRPQYLITPRGLILMERHLRITRHHLDTVAETVVVRLKHQYQMVT